MWIGALLTVLMVVMLAFSGALLSWSTQAARHANVVASAAGELPIIGSWLRRLLLGGADASGATLPRAFGFHVAVLPALLTLLLAVQATFVARGSTSKDAARMPLYPDALVRFATVGVGALCVMVTLATFVRPDPGQVSSHPPWYLAVVHALARTMPATVLGMSGTRALVALGSMATVVLVALPFLDPRGSRLVAYLGWILFAALVAITIHALA
jgi:quinol-cytochrome oxidoreductase complex cytochrome b subunit